MASFYRRQRLLLIILVVGCVCLFFPHAWYRCRNDTSVVEDFRPSSLPRFVILIFASYANLMVSLAYFPLFWQTIALLCDCGIGMMDCFRCVFGQTQSRKFRGWSSLEERAKATPRGRGCRSAMSRNKAAKKRCRMRRIWRGGADRMAPSRLAFWDAAGSSQMPMEVPK